MSFSKSFYIASVMAGKGVVGSGRCLAESWKLVTGFYALPAAVRSLYDEYDDSVKVGSISFNSVFVPRLVIAVASVVPTVVGLIGFLVAHADIKTMGLIAGGPGLTLAWGHALYIRGKYKYESEFSANVSSPSDGNQTNLPVPAESRQSDTAGQPFQPGISAEEWIKKYGSGPALAPVV